MHTFNRVFDGENVPLVVGVDGIQHGGQGGGLARTRRARHQHETARAVGQVHDDGRQIQVFDRGNLAGNDAQGGGDVGFVAIGVDTKTRHVLRRVSHVELQLVLETLDLLVRQDVVNDA